MIERLLCRIEKEVPGHGSFDAVSECFQNENPELAIGRYQLSVKRIEGIADMNSGQHYVEASVFPLEGYYKAEMLLVEGSKKEIVQ